MILERRGRLSRKTARLGVPILATQRPGAEASVSHFGTAPWHQTSTREQAMSNILILNSSVLGHASVSRVLVEEAVARLTGVDPGATIVHRDLGAAPIPHLTAATVAGVRGDPVTDAQLTARTLSNELIAELRNADTIVIGAPMYN